MGAGTDDTADRAHVRVGEWVFDTRDEGPRGTGRHPVVLLHGFPEDGSCYDRVVPSMHAAGLRTIVPDQRGYSPGARPAGRARERTAYRLGLLVGDVIGLMDELGVAAAHVVGHDWGGAVAWALAGAHPDRVRSLTVLSTPHPTALAHSMVTSRQLLKSWYMVAFQVPWLPEYLLGRTLEKSLRNSGLRSCDVTRYAARLAEPGALTAALGWYRSLPLSGLGHVRACTVPTTYVWGEHDFALGRAAAEQTGAHVVADYRFVVLDAGHWLPENHADEVVELILDRVRSVDAESS